MCKAGESAGGMFGNPILPATGEKLKVETDFTDASPHGLDFTRYYRTQWADIPPAAGMGSHWNHRFAIQLTGTGSNSLSKTIQLADGSQRRFTRSATTAPWLNTDGTDSLVESTAGTLFKSAQSDDTWQFNSAGKLVTMTQRNGWAYQLAYNPAGQLATVTNQFGRSLSFSYNATAQTNATLGQSYVYADGQLPEYALLAEYGNGAASGAGRLEYIWLPTDSGAAIPIGVYRGSRFYAIHADHLNTPRLMTDDSNKAVWQWPYSAFGDNKPTGILKATASPNNAVTQDQTTNALLKATSLAVKFNLRFPGQYADDESNMFYNMNRSYRPGSADYNQFDPIGLDGGWNRKGYVGANPLSFTDPEGLATAGSTVGGAIGGWGGGAIGGALGGPPGAIAGRWIGGKLGSVAGSAIEDLCTPDDPCPPCKTLSGKIVKVGTIAYRPLDSIPDNEIQHGVYGSHHNIFVAKQAPRSSPQPCRCQWVKQKYVLKPHQLTQEMIPIEPFAY